VKAMILCAGLGTRLRPLTDVWPKPALPLLGQPLFRYNLALLVRAGCTAVCINTHWLPEEMERTARVECARAGVPLSCALEPVIQGTGGGIRSFRDQLADDDFLVLNGDILFAIELRAIISAHRASKAAATLVLMPMPEGERYAAVEIDASAHVRRIAGLGPGGAQLLPWHFTGVHVMSPRVFDFMTPTGAEDINRDVYVKMIAKGLPVVGHVAQAYWSDLGTPARYLATTADLLFGQVPLDAFPHASPFEGLPKKDNAWVHPRAVLEEDVRIAGPAFIGEGAKVLAGARIGAAVSIGAGATVGAGASVNRSVGMENSEVPARALVEDAVVSGSSTVPARR